MEEDEQVVTPDGGLCTIKDCCVVICEDEPTPNPGRGAFADRSVIDPAFDAVCKSVEKSYGFVNAEKVATVLYALPIVFNPRLSRAIGRAKFKSMAGVPYATVIELTGSVDIPSDYMHNLLIHEGCHVAHCVLAQGGFAFEQPHGSRWQELMIGAGAKPEAKCSDPRLLNTEKMKERYDRSRLRRGGPAVALKPEDVQVGDYVSFEVPGKTFGMPDPRVRVSARVIAKEPHQAFVEHVTEDGQFTRRHMRWRVGYGLLTKETAP